MGYLQMSGGLVYLAIGIAALVISLQNPTLNCGLTGQPPLREWLFGTGISYTIIGVSTSFIGALLVFTVIGTLPVFAVSVLAGAFTFAWMIVGAFSLWRDGADCNTLNYPIWACSMAAVIISIVMVVYNIVSAVTCYSQDESGDRSYYKRA